ncbi:hypothetical protein FA13DRAFT_184561 [Coprinellus micaceus]|uniref:Uncharacterized protein n=1 Tax=Coprinellus micaceus TaxID=71717 RepID=A0A4Y7THM3_COPMI|nr:hypothetical protein FA13DRAFT_184561 [Coprinellus micaceus]
MHLRPGQIKPGLDLLLPAQMLIRSQCRPYYEPGFKLKQEARRLRARQLKQTGNHKQHPTHTLTLQPRREVGSGYTACEKNTHRVVMIPTLAWTVSPRTGITGSQDSNDLAGQQARRRLLQRQGRLVDPGNTFHLATTTTTTTLQTGYFLMLHPRRAPRMGRLEDLKPPKGEASFAPNVVFVSAS